MSNDRGGNPLLDTLSLPIWCPDEQTVERSHIAEAMKIHAFDTYEQLYEWSITQPDRFWTYVLKSLDIRFDRPPQQVLDLTQGPAAADWLVDASMNIAESCFTSAADCCAIIEGRPDGSIRKFTYAELRALSNRVARGLLAHGIKQREAVAVFLPMTAESVAIYLGIVLAGCTVVSIADSFSADEVRSRLTIGRATAVFTVMSAQRGDKQIPVYPRVVEADGPMAIIVERAGATVAQSSQLLRDIDIAWPQLLSDDASDIVVNGPPDTAMNILFSSGTTGTPKAIIWDHSTPIKAAADGLFHQDIHAGEVIAWPTNLGWMMGPWLIYATLINRGTIALYDGAPGEIAFGRFVQTARVNMLGVVPSLVRSWRESNCLASVDWSAIRVFSSTGECSNPADMRWLSETAGGRPIIEYCGGTEIGGGYMTSTVVQPNLPAMFSSPALGSAIVTLDQHGESADVGEVYLVPPALGLSRRLIDQDHHSVYYADAPTAPDGQLLRQHGDRMQRISANQIDNPQQNGQERPPCIGYYRALGRTDDTMNLGGIKVGTADIERTVADVPGIREVAAVAVAPSEGGPARLLIFVGANAARLAQPAELQHQMQTLVKSHLNPLFRIHEVVVMDKLPRTASNKIMRRTLRDVWLHRREE
ncbi:MAG: AMP-binding protein [Fuerstiella sp.]|nr:AMP-binding protein [Fuerstiella sp.]